MAQTKALPDPQTPEELAERQRGADKVSNWVKEIEEAERREKEFRKMAKGAQAIYECGDGTSTQFNILYANTETMLPALYSNVPRPVIKRRFNDADPLGLLATKACERMLSYLADMNDSRYDTFDNLLRKTTLGGLVPGRGVVFFKYDAEFDKQAPGAEVGTTDSAETDTATHEAGESLEVEGAEQATGQEDVSPEESVSYETVCGEFVPWYHFLHGYATSWNRVPWVGRKHYFTQDELKKNFPDLWEYVPLDASSSEAEEAETVDHTTIQAEDNETKLAYVVEIWDKVSRRVIFVAPSFPDMPLRDIPDPLELSGFFPCPKPLTLVEKVADLVPIPLYEFYKGQAIELNQLTLRIQNIVKALKVRGYYDSTMQGVEDIFTADELTMLPIDGAATLTNGGSLDRMIWFMPVEKLANTLQQLLLERQNVKAVIYELTGISDILRGASQASETATAQNIKSQWGSLRIKRLQHAVQDFARECFRIMAEISASKFSEDTWSEVTGLPYPTTLQKEDAQAQLQQIQEVAAQQAAVTPQMPGMPPPQPPQIPPQLASAAQSPSWGDVLGLLRNLSSRKYRVDIETNSTLEVEASEDQKMIGDLLNAISQFLNGAAPLVESGVMPWEVAKEIMLSIVRRFRFGAEVEEALGKMQPPQPKEDPKKEEAPGKSPEAIQAESQAAIAAAQAKMQQVQMDMELAKAKHQLAMEELQMKREELALNRQLAAQQPLTNGAPTDSVGGIQQAGAQNAAV